MTYTLTLTNGTDTEIEINCSTCRQRSVAACEECREVGDQSGWTAPTKYDHHYAVPVLKGVEDAKA
jgi:hypothetical protein